MLAVISRNSWQEISAGPSTVVCIGDSNSESGNKFFVGSVSKEIFNVKTSMTGRTTEVSIPDGGDIAHLHEVRRCETKDENFQME